MRPNVAKLNRVHSRRKPLWQQLSSADMHPLLDRFEKLVESQPTRAAACDQSLMLEYRAFRAIACGLARQIASRSEKPRIGILAPTSTACAAAIFGCWYAGRTPVPLNFFLAPPELAKIARDADLDLVVTIEHFLPAVQAVGVTPLVMDANSLTPGSTAPPDALRDDLGVIIYTSGTSGDPKGVCLTFDNLLSNADACITHARITPDQVFLSVLPQFHSFGFTAMTVVPLVLGATVWYTPRFSPHAVIHLIEEHKVTIFMAVASMYAALAKMKKADPAALASLRLAVSGGEALSPRLANLFKERFGVDLLEGYGMTESSPVATLNVPWARRLGSVGTPLPGVEVFPVDAHGAALPRGQEGELIIRGHCVMAGYHNKPDLTAAAVRGGSLYTGDIGRIDADGFVYITGRAKEMIIVGGENVFPREIEEALLTHPAVAEAAVIGAHDDLRGELPIAFVIPAEGASIDETALRTHCRDKLAGYKIPRDIYISADLPRGPTGKILKRALKPPTA